MYHCKFEKCEKKYSTKFSSIRHFNSSHVPNPVIHTCIECGSVKTHKSTHTLEGQIKREKQEFR